MKCPLFAGGDVKKGTVVSSTKAFRGVRRMDGRSIRSAVPFCFGEGLRGRDHEQAAKRELIRQGGDGATFPVKRECLVRFP